MMRAARLGLLTTLIAAAAMSGGCSILAKGNVFKREDPAILAAQRAGRQPLVAAGDVVTASGDLAGRGFTLPSAAPRADWQLPGGGPEQAAGHIEAAPNFRVAWTRAFGQGSSKSAHVTAPPILAGGRLFVMDGEAGVRAIDAQTGRLIWRANFRATNRRDGEGYGGGVAFADGKLYVASGMRFIAQLDPANGAVIWRTDTVGPLRSAPTVASGRVFAIDNNNDLQAFDITTGQQTWNYQALSEPSRILAATSPAVTGDTLVAAFGSGEVVRLRAANGTELWPPQTISRISRTTALTEIRDIPGRPVIQDGAVYVAGHSGVVAALDLQTGQPRWRQPISSIATPLPVGDVVYVVSRAGELLCLSKEDGRAYWVRDLNAGRRDKDRAIWTGPVMASGRLILASSTGQAISVDPNTGAVQRTIRVGGPVLITPIAADGKVFLVTDEARLVAIG